MLLCLDSISADLLKTDSEILTASIEDEEKTSGRCGVIEIDAPTPPPQSLTADKCNITIDLSTDTTNAMDEAVKTPEHGNGRVDSGGSSDKANTAYSCGLVLNALRELYRYVL